MRFLMQVAWRNMWRHKRRSLITAGAMAMGMALCMFMIAFSDGIYQKMFDIMVSQKLGHVQVHHPDYPKKKILHDTIVDAEALLADVETVPLTLAAAPRVYSYGLFASGEQSTGGQLVGIDDVRENLVSSLSDDIIDGTFTVGDHQAMVGRGLADTLKVGVGDELIVIVQAADGSMGNDLYEIAGIYKTGSAALDRAGAFVSMSDLQTLVALEGQVHEILVLTEDSDDSAALGAALGALPTAKGKLVRTWFEADPTTADMMNLQDAGAFIMLFFVFSLASFGILNTMLMAVFERTRELGVLRALGLKPRQMMAMVLLESVFLAVLATLIGGALGGVLDAYAVFYGIDMSMGVGGESFEYQGVQFDQTVMGVVRPEGIILTLVTVFLVSVLAGVYPAWRAARLRPVEAMREV